MSKGRSIVQGMWTNFWNSIKLRPKEICVGRDQNGTTYYEIPVQSWSTKNRPSRWFVPEEKDNFQQDIPCEWESWLRHRRKDPPTDEEISLNHEKMLMRIENAKNLQKASARKQLPQIETKSPQKAEFPTYDDYELTPGSKNIT